MTMDGNLTWIGVMIYLGDLGFEKIVIDYSGGGDSGAIDEINYLHKGRKGETEDHKTRSKRKELVDDKVHDFIHDQAYKKLEDIEDWWNNEGGNGMMTISIPSGEFHIDNNINHTESTLFKHDGTFGEQEEN